MGNRLTNFLLKSWYYTADKHLAITGLGIVSSFSPVYIKLGAIRLRCCRYYRLIPRPSGDSLTNGKQHKPDSAPRITGTRSLGSELLARLLIMFIADYYVNESWISDTTPLLLCSSGTWYNLDRTSKSAVRNS